MCGICGIWQPPGARFVDPADVLKKMATRLAHRGPDDEGGFRDDIHGIGLGFRRLAINDLTREGHQPMTSASGRFVIVFNGEIYNHKRLRPELERLGCVFRGHSDTEVMLAAIEQWGLEKALDAFIGMFAFALWDKREATLTLARDRLGIKPLYFGHVGGVFVFASELPAIASVPGFAATVDHDAFCLFLQRGVVPAPRSIYQDIAKLLPGTMLRLDARRAQSGPRAIELAEGAESFWSARKIVRDSAARLQFGTDEAAADHLEALLRDAVALRMEADVPLGAFLSGGVDSSTVVALMQAQATRPVKTFSIGFEENDYNEAPFAHAVATHLRTEHHELYLSAKDTLDVVPLLPSIYGEPFADASQIPTFLVSQLARGDVTVCLSGDGGDEVFGGYTRYFVGQDLRRWVERVPPFARAAAGACLRAPSAVTWDKIAGAKRILYRGKAAKQGFGRKVHRLARVLHDSSAAGIYSSLMSEWRREDSVTAARCYVEGWQAPPPQLPDVVEQLQWLDMTTYLPDDILAKVDRASMACSLEARVPFLDHRVVELAWQLPLDQKIRGTRGKWLLRKVLDRHVPSHLIDRPKRGFEIPLKHWLRGPLRDWGESLLDARRLRDEGFFNPAPVRAAWQQHLAGRQNWAFRLWYVLMFQAWLESTSRQAR